MKNYFKIVVVAISLLSLNSCKNDSKPTKKLKIVTTTGMIADGINHIVGNGMSVVSLMPEAPMSSATGDGEFASVEALMGSGVDPHLYKPTQGDIKKLSEADIIIYNGLHLEGKMQDIFEKLKKTKTVIALSDGINPAELRKLNATTYDPHIWFSVALWEKAIDYAANAIIAKDTANAKYYHKNTEVYLHALTDLESWVQREIAKIPQPQKIMITAHDAFGYFGNQYHVKVKGLQGISTVTEFGLKDITDLVEYIVVNKVKSVFVESSVPTRAIDAVVAGCKAKGHNIKIGGTLYSDAMGEKGTEEGTYVGMVKSNVTKIVNGLK